MWAHDISSLAAPAAYEETVLVCKSCFGYLKSIQEANDERTEFCQHSQLCESLQSCAFNRCHLAKVFNNFFTGFMSSRSSKDQSGCLGILRVGARKLPRRPDWCFDGWEAIKLVKKLSKTLARWHRLNAHDCKCCQDVCFDMQGRGLLPFDSGRSPYSRIINRL